MATPCSVKAYGFALRLPHKKYLTEMKEYDNQKFHETG